MTVLSDLPTEAEWIINRVTVLRLEIIALQQRLRLLLFPPD